MKTKKLVAMVTLFIILALQFSFVPSINVYANSDTQENVNSDNFHYAQLTDNAKKIYDALYTMYVNGTLKKGNEDFDLVANGYFTENEAMEYQKGNSELNSAMNAARYAFYADYPELFYVSFQKLSIRATKDSNNKYHIYLGSGRYSNYYIDGITSENIDQALKDFNTRVDEIVEKANNVTADEGQDLTVVKIKFVHNEIIRNTGYRLEDACTEGNESFIGTPYGALVKGESVCEGYARALKTVLDKLNINSILVQGMHQNEGCAPVEHMWNYVQLEKETNARSSEKVWYAIDATLDDPFINELVMSDTNELVSGSRIVEGFENTRYCLVGQEMMNREHTAIEKVEAAGGYTFKYPELNVEDYGIDTVTNDNGLVVKFKQEGNETEDYKAGDFYISYNNKGYYEAEKEGKYLLSNYYYYFPGDEVWKETGWAYLWDEPYGKGAFDFGDHIYLSLPNSEYVEFAVTTLAPSGDKKDFDYPYYKGDESDFIASSGKLYNPNGTYKGRPYLTSLTPGATSSLTVGKTYPVTAVYDDDLVLAEGATEAGFKLESDGPTGVENTKITNFKFDGKRTITFDIEFSKMFADDQADYTINITGLVGFNSKKAPIAINYGARNWINCPFNMNNSKNWEVFGTPQLLETEDLSLNDWETSDGSKVSDKLKSRVSLVTTKTTKDEAAEMNELIKNEPKSGKVLASETYNISLNVCKKYVVRTGHRLQISVGFPAGYGPDDAGVTFKAYHFTTNNEGEVIVEEIPCVVTQYGLIITCDAFSPFAITAVEADKTQVAQKKSAIVSSKDGGQITGTCVVDEKTMTLVENGNIFTLEENGSQTISVKANEGFEIETITVCGKALDVTNKDSMDVTVNYDDIDITNNIIEATFVAKEVIEKEEERNEAPIVQTTAAPSLEKSFDVTINSADETLDLNALRPDQEFELNVNIRNFTNIDESIVVLTGKLEYDKDVLELVDVKGKGIWNLSKDYFNPENYKFVTDSSSVMTEEGDIFTVTFKVLDIDENTSTSIKIYGVEAGDGIGTEEISGNSAKLNMNVELIEKIESEKYTISDEEYIIYGVDAKTTIATFKQNTTTKQNIKFIKFIKNENGETVEIEVEDETTYISTGMKVKVGETLEYRFVVMGDVDGNGKIGANDLAKLKLHIINIPEIKDELVLKAADVDGNGKIGANDLAKIKLVILNENKKTENNVD